MAGNGTKHHHEEDASLDEDGKYGHFAMDVAGRGLGMRHLQTVLMAVASFTAYSLRSNLSVAIVAMVRTKHNDENSTGPSVSEYPPTYDWGEDTQGLVLSSFFWGYLTTQIPAGIITERFGGHTFLCAAVLISSILTMMIPQCVYFGGWQLLCANRVLQGISQGFVYPSIYTLLGVWAPPQERGRLSGAALGAQLLGTMAATPLSGWLSGAYGWPFVFYWFGAVGAVVGLALIFFGANYPRQHRFITESEKNYIEQSLGGAKVKLRIPWKQILTSVPAWAAIFTLTSQAVVFLAFLTKIPTYLGTVLKFNIKENGVLSALPYFVAFLLCYIFSWSCDLIAKRGWMGLTAARKVFNSIGHFGSALCMILMGYTESTTMSVCLLTLAVGILSGTYPGVQANFVDLAPNFSGTVFSIANFMCACFGVTGPIVIGFIVSESGSAAQWRIVFFLKAAVLVIGNVIFLFLGTADTQYWNWPDSPEDNLHDQKAKEKPESEKQIIAVPVS